VREVQRLLTEGEAGTAPCIYRHPSSVISEWWSLKATELDGWHEPITLPPAAKPGMYLAICDVLP